MKNQTSAGNHNLFSAFADHYDRMINWNSRLQREIPFYKKIFKDAGAGRVLDAASGTGRHAIMFASWGLDVYAADASEDMVLKAVENARQAGVEVQFKAVELEDIDKEFPPGFDVITCMGNSLPHIRTTEGLEKVLAAIYNLLKPEGIFAVQVRNYRRVFEKNEKYMPLNTFTDGKKEYLYLRVTEPGEDLVTFSIIVFFKNEEGKWSFEVKSEKLKPWMFEELEGFFAKSGFTLTGIYGGLDLSSFDSPESADLVIIARKKAG